MKFIYTVIATILMKQSVGVKDLHIMHISGLDLYSRNGGDCGSSVDFAAHLVNQRDDVLPGYRIHLHHRLLRDGEVGAPGLFKNTF